ncbi:MAG TPA: hypothetical protein VF112_01220 [Candidatus Dormibacteraeota bacterium]
MGRPASALIGLLLVACGASTTTGEGTPTAAPTATPPAPPVSAAMIMAVADRVFLRTPQSGAAYGECDNGDDFSACPVTARLLGRLEQHPLSGGAGGALPFCRCQDFSTTLSVTVTPAVGGGIAHVTLFGSAVIDLVMTVVHGTLLVDDTRCGGRGATTSLFANPVIPCSPLSAHYP